MSAQTVLFDHPGPRARRRNTVVTVVGWLVVLGFVGLLVWSLREQFTAVRLAPFVDPVSWESYIVPGLLRTLQAAGISVLTSVVLGILLGCGRLSTVVWVRGVCGTVVEVFRALPVLIMMIFWWYIAIFVIQQGTAASQSLFGVVMGLTLYNASVIAELVRSGVYSLPKGQGEAGLAIGMTPGQVLTTIQLPQAITTMLPSIISQLVVILKDTALGSVILYSELIKEMYNLAIFRGNLIASFTFAGIVFILINYGLTRVATLVERRLRASRSGGGPQSEQEREQVALNAEMMANQTGGPGGGGTARGPRP